MLLCSIINVYNYVFIVIFLHFDGYIWIEHSEQLLGETKV
jgi:hypothetical protein